MKYNLNGKIINISDAEIAKNTAKNTGIKQILAKEILLGKFITYSPPFYRINRNFPRG